LTPKTNLDHIYRLFQQRSKHISIAKPSQLMPYREIITISHDNHTKHINTQCRQYEEFLEVKPGGTHTNY